MLQFLKSSSICSLLFRASCKEHIPSLLALQEPFTKLLVFFLNLLFVGLLAFLLQQGSNHGYRRKHRLHAPQSVRIRIYFHCGMGFTGSGSPINKGTLKFWRCISPAKHHFVQGRGNQTTQPNDIDLGLFGSGDNFFRGPSLPNQWFHNCYPKPPKRYSCQYRGRRPYGRHQNFAVGPCGLALVRLNIRQQVCCCFSSLGRFWPPRQKHFTTSEEIAHTFIPTIKGPSITSMGFGSMASGFLHIYFNKSIDSFYQSSGNAFL